MKKDDRREKYKMLTGKRLQQEQKKKEKVE